MAFGLITSVNTVFGRKFISDLEYNLEKLDKFADDSIKSLQTHKTTEKKAHTADQINYGDEPLSDFVGFLNGRISNLVLGHNGDGINEVKDARVDNLGTTHPTLQDRLRRDYLNYMVDKKEIIEKVDSTRQELLGIENRFDPQNQEPQFVTDLSPYYNAVMQSFWIDPKTHVIYMTQAHGNGKDYLLTRLKPNGQYIDNAIVKNGGHGTHNGYRYINNELWIYSHILDSNGNNKLVKFKYKPGEIKYGVDTKDVFTGDSVNRYVTAIVNQKENLMIYRKQTTSSERTKLGILNYVEIRNLDDIDKGIDKLLYRVDIPMNLTGNTQPMQGVTYDNGILYWYTGDANPSNPNYLTTFDVKTGDKIYQRVVEIGGVSGIFTGDFAEAEGMSMYYDKETNKKALLFGVTTGPGNNRHHEIHMIAQRGLDDLLRARAFPVLMTDSGGRVKSLPAKGLGKLLNVQEVGYYYLYTADTKSITDFPVSSLYRNAGWHLEVIPGSFKGTMIQRLTRSSTGRNMLKFERIINVTTNLAGPWNYVKATAGFWERVPAGITKLSDLNIVGMTYYITTEESKRFTDFPKNFKGVAGWCLENEQINNGSFRQVLKRNNYDYYHQMFVRNIAKTATSKWSLFEGKEVD